MSSDDDPTSMRRRTVLKGICAAGVLGAGSAAVTAYSSTDGNQEIAERTARLAADSIGGSSEFDDWRAEGVASPELFYARVRDGSGTRAKYIPSAWAFPVERGAENVGYIAVDAAGSGTSVLTFGRSTAPQRRLESAQRVARDRDRTTNGRFLYHSGVKFGVETTDERIVDLRGQWLSHISSLERPEHLRAGYRSEDDGDDAQDWSGDTDDEISGVPNWTESDSGGGSSTEIGTGDDEWNEWDGCSPIAASMAIGFHEDISESDDDDRESLIDRLHKKMNTNDEGGTRPNDIDGAIDKYDAGEHDYNGTNRHHEEKGNIKDAVGNDNPCLLNMWKGPYTDDYDEEIIGHSVTVVGYRTTSSGMRHKVHNGYNESPDRVKQGNWRDAMITRIKKSEQKSHVEPFQRVLSVYSLPSRMQAVR
jgi:hypothetical protein